MNQSIEVSKTDQKISKAVSSFSEEEVAIIANTVAKNTTSTELAFFLSVCQSVELNPFNKEIWCYKDHKQNLIIFAGRDGLLVKAQKNPVFNGIRSSEVRENDEFELDVANDEITHKFTGTNKERGAIIGAYARVFRKDGESTIEWADFSEYNKGSFTWKTHASEMIKKTAESHALKKAFGLAGVQLEEDWNVDKNNVAEPIKHKDHSELDEISTVEEAEVVEEFDENAVQCDACGAALTDKEEGVCNNCRAEMNAAE